jgi:hypothetical protein
MSLFTAIADFFTSLFGNVSIKSAKLAGLFIAANNSEKVKVILPFAKIGLAQAKSGAMTEAQWQELMNKVLTEVKDPKFKLIVSEFITVPNFTGKGAIKANEQVAKLLDAFILGLEAGV